jgi:tetratricopeptide (TPR) repeat protein
MFPIMVLSFLACLFAGCGDGSGASPDVPAAEDDGSDDVARGMAALSQQDATAAVAAFAAAAAKCPGNFEAQMQLAIVSTRLGDAAAATSAAARAVELRPDSAEALLVSGQAAYLRKDYAKAVVDFSAVTREKSLPADVRSEAWAGRGVVELARGLPDVAHISFIRARRLNRRNASAWYHLGMLSRDSFHYDAAAQEQFEMASRLLDARDPRAKKISRDILPALRRSIAASAAAKDGVARRDPAKAAKLLSEGRALQSKKMITAAMKKYEAAFAADPLSGPAALAFAKLKGANVRVDSDVDKALAAYRAASDVNPAAQATYVAAAQLAYKHKRWSTAVAVLEHAVAHDSDNVQTLDLLIAALRKAGKGAQAEGWQEYRKELR